MLELRLLEQYPESDWSNLVERCGGNPLHLPRVHTADRSRTGLRFLVFSEGGSEVACGPAFLEASGRRLFASRGRTLELPTPPAAGGRAEGGRRELYDGLLRHCRDSGYRRIVIGHAWGDSFREITPLSEHITETVVEFVLNLEPDLDRVRAGMHKIHRKNIRRAGGHGLTVRAESSLSALLQLRTVQRVSAERAAAHGHGFSVRDPEYFRRVHECVYAAGIGEVLLAFQGEECVAALAYLWTGTKGITVRSGCTAQGYETDAMYLLQEAVLERAKEKGLLEINLGGGPAEAEKEQHPQHGLYRFKKGFGGEPFLRTAVAMDLASFGL